MKNILLTTFVVIASTAAATTYARAGDRPQLVIGLNDQPAKLEPADAPLSVDMRVTYSVFDTLIRRDYASEQTAGHAVLIPSLATAWKRIDDRTIELKLRQNVKFHNGDTLTAQDVAFTFSKERIFGDKALVPTAKRYLGDIEAVEIIDPETIRIRAARPNPVLELRLADTTAAVVNERAYREMGVNGFKRHPVGTGPAKFVQWDDGDKLTFEPFDNYWGGKPAFGRLVFRVIPDSQARLACLINHECDLIVQVDPDQLSTISSYEYLKTEESVIENLQVIWFVGTEPYVKDKRIRQALSLSIDRNLLVQALWSGKTTVPTSWQISAFGDLFDPQRQDFVFDPQKAKRLLAEAGYDGGEILIRNVSGYYPFGDQMIQAVQKMWQNVGLNVKLQMVENVAQSYQPGRSIGTGSVSFLMPAPEGLGYALFEKGGLAETRHGFQPSTEFKKLVGTFYSTADGAVRKTTYKQILDYLADEMPATAVYMMPQFYGVSTKINWHPIPNYPLDFRPDSFAFKVGE
ncbi:MULTISPECIES: ABC transporter substrate-binding protein [Rhizobium]|nr:ABC transporter substrate-binding protein [Rhizobium leguminosarum]